MAGHLAPCGLRRGGSRDAAGCRSPWRALLAGLLLLLLAGAPPHGGGGVLAQGGSTTLPSTDIADALALDPTVQLEPNATYTFATSLLIDPLNLGSPSSVVLVGQNTTFLCTDATTAVSVVNASLSVTGVTFTGCTGTALRVQGGEATALALTDCHFSGNRGDSAVGGVGGHTVGGGGQAGGGDGLHCVL